MHVFTKTIENWFNRDQWTQRCPTEWAQQRFFSPTLCEDNLGLQFDDMTYMISQNCRGIHKAPQKEVEVRDFRESFIMITIIFRRCPIKMCRFESTMVSLVTKIILNTRSLITILICAQSELI